MVVTDQLHEDLVQLLMVEARMKTDLPQVGQRLEERLELLEDEGEDEEAVKKGQQRWWEQECR